MPTIAICDPALRRCVEQLRDEVVRRVDVEDARLQRDQHLVGELHHLVEALAVQAGRRVEHDVGRALGRPHDRRRGATSQALIVGRPGGPQAEPGARRLLAVDVAQHHARGRARRSSRRGWSRACVLPTPPFGLATTITGMQHLPFSRVCGYVSGARAPRHRANQRSMPMAEPSAAARSIDATACRAPTIARHRRPPAAGAVAREPPADAGGARAAAREPRRRGSRCATSTRSIPTT